MSMTRNQPFKRTDRVADQLRKVASEVLSQKIHNWGIEGMTITHVDVSPDLKHAKAFYRLLDPSTKHSVKENLMKVLPIIRKEIGRLMQTKYTPQVQFVYDDTLDHGDRIFELLDQAKNTSSS